jgi:hypothetical protein
MPVMPRHATASRTAVLVLAASALAGCGQEDPSIPPATSSPTRSASFPVTITRTGGVAGFRDSVSVQADGSVFASTKQGEVRCRLHDQALDDLREGAAPIQDTDSPTSAPPVTADAMEVLIGAGTGTASIADPRVAPAVPVVNQLLADVTGPAAARKVCT